MYIYRFYSWLKPVRLLAIGGILVVSSIAGLFIQPPSNASALSGSQFNAGRIIDDAVFFNKNAMSASQIQAFLNSKVPNCDTSGAAGPYYDRYGKKWSTRAAYGAAHGSPAPYTCLKNYKKTTSNIAPESGICNGYSAGSNETAATIIYKVAQSCGINPQVLLVMLQKEQSLVTDDWPWPIQYQKAMGAFCPDTAPCDSGYAGFFKQMYYGAHRLKVYTANPTSFNYSAGRNNTIYYHPDLQRCGSSNIYIQNQATANLYIYTPYQPNRSALNNLYGEGDSCASYGNRNFWRMFNDWFGPTLSNMLPGGATVQRESSTGKMYLVAENKKYLIPSPEYLTAYNLSAITVQTASSQSLAAYTDKGRLSNIIRDNETGRIDMVNNGGRYWVPNPTTCTDWALDCFNTDVVKALPSYIINRLTDSGNIKPLARANNGTVYVLKAGKKSPIHSPSTLANLGYSWSQVVSLQSFNLTQPLGPLKITDRAVLKFSPDPSIYYFDGNAYHTIPNMATLEAWGMSKRVVKPSTSSYNSTPPESNSTLSVWSQIGDKKYLIDGGRKILLSPPQYTMWPAATYQTFSAIEAHSLPETTMKKFIRVSPDIYMIDGSKKRYIPSMSDLVALGQTASNITSLSAYSANDISEGSNALGSSSLIKIPGSPDIYVVSNNQLLRIKSPSMLHDFGFNWSNIETIQSSKLAGYATGELSQKVKYSSGYSFYSGGKQLFVPAAYYAKEFGLSTSSYQTINDRIANHRRRTTITRFLRDSNNGAIYYGSGQALHYVSSMDSFRRYGGNGKNMISVPHDFILQFAIGKPI